MRLYPYPPDDTQATRKPLSWDRWNGALSDFAYLVRSHERVSRQWWRPWRRPEQEHLRCSINEVYGFLLRDRVAVDEALRRVREVE